MKGLAKKVELLEITDVFKIDINRDGYFKNAYVIDLPLDSTPNHVWQEVLDTRWKASRQLWDRKLFVVGDKLRLVTSIEDVEDKVNWVRQIVDETNRRIEEYNQEEIARDAQVKEEAREKSSEEDRMNVDAIRDTLKRRLGAL